MYENKFKQRIRFSSSEQTLYIDIMLSLDQLLSIGQDEKNRIVLNNIIEEVPPIVLKYKKKIKDFDFDKFLLDFKKCFGERREESE